MQVPNAAIVPNSIVQINLEQYNKDAKVVLQSHHRVKSNHSSEVKVHVSKPK